MGVRHAGGANRSVVCAPSMRRAGHACVADPRRTLSRWCNELHRVSAVYAIVGMSWSRSAAACILANALSGSWRGALHSYGGAHRGEFGLLWGGGSIMMPCPWEPPGKDSGSRRFQDARAHTVGQRFGRAPAGAGMVPRRSGGIPVERTMEWCLPVFAWSACRRTRAISAGCQWGFDFAAISAQSSSGDNSSAGVYRACTTIE